MRFELTQGAVAEGTVKIIQEKDGYVNYVSGSLSAPETGKFFFLRPPAGGKAGKAVGVIELPASQTAYRIEPTGPNGDPELWQRRLNEVICMDMPEVAPVFLRSAVSATNRMENEIPVRPDLEPDYVPSYNSNIVSLQSYSGSPAVLLLDFFGGSTTYWGGVEYARPPVDNNIVKDIWKRVAEDYIPFNINVTTDLKVYQSAAEGSRMRCCFTTTPVTAAGVAYEGSWNWGGDIMCWSVYYTGKAAAEVAGHEPGHTLGLSHDGQDIGTKYVAPPHSTDFGIMFLPTEGLFAEVVRRPGLIDALRREARVTVAGPTTLMATLVALQSGFRTLAIQQRSSEVWQVLGAVKSEFEKFGGVLDKVGTKLGEAQKVVEAAGVRRRAVDRKLRDVEALPEATAAAVLTLTAGAADDDEVMAAAE